MICNFNKCLCFLDEVSLEVVYKEPNMSELFLTVVTGNKEGTVVIAGMTNGYYSVYNVKRSPPLLFYSGQMKHTCNIEGIAKVPNKP